MQPSNCYKVKINFIRHGQTPSNHRHLYISSTDEDLSEEGISELQNRSYPPCDLVFTSGFRRCNKTAEIIYKKNDIIEVPYFAELDFGDFEGKGYEDLKDNPLYRTWLDSRGILATPNGESREDFIERLKSGFSEVLEKSRGSKEISLVVHGGTIMGLISSYTDLDYYDVQLKCGEYISCMVSFEEVNGNFFVSHFCIMDGGRA